MSKPVEITFGRSLKVLWSYFWRATLMLFPFMGVVMAISFAVGTFPKPGQTPDPQHMAKNAGVFFIIWAVMMVGGFFLHIYAMKLALKVKWMDFKLIAVSTDEG